MQGKGAGDHDLSLAPDAPKLAGKRMTAFVAGSAENHNTSGTKTAPGGPAVASVPNPAHGRAVQPGLVARRRRAGESGGRRALRGLLQSLQDFYRGVDISGVINADITGT
jgi:hypothetical protein